MLVTGELAMTALVLQVPGTVITALCVEGFIFAGQEDS